MAYVKCFHDSRIRFYSKIRNFLEDMSKLNYDNTLPMMNKSKFANFYNDRGAKLVHKAA